LTIRLRGTSSSRYTDLLLDEYSVETDRFIVSTLRAASADATLK